MKKFVNITLRIIVVLLIISLVLAYLASWISPEKVWILAFFGLAYPYILLATIILMILRFLAGKYKEGILILFFIVLGWGQLRRFFRIPVKTSPELLLSSDSISHLTLLTFNVRLFNLYHEQPVSEDSIFKFIRSTQADIVCLQEIFTSTSKMTEEMLVHHIQLPYYHFLYTIRNKNNMNYGMAMFSKYPIVGSYKLKYPDTYNSSMYCDIRTGKDTLRIFNNHLQSTRLGKNKNNFISTTNQGESLKEILEISEHLKEAFIKRARQAEMLKHEIDVSPYRVIVCGDFNDTPVSYAYHKVAGDLKDAFLFNGKWLGKTYAGLLPSFRIDYVFTSPSLHPVNFQRYRIPYSDHFPILCSIVVPPVKKEDVQDQHSPRIE